ncbi:MAG: HIT domain-containing protein [Rickettsiales bacterium]|jgi:diadenosine tetraphosphate (Ap4A) HIT family hydrolase|nr:HIT domain-containing protein [Rickettsiales bacterium]
MICKTYDDDNIFAKILRGEIPAAKITENKFALAFKDIHPKAPFHALVVPKGAYSNIYHFIKDAPEAEQIGFWKLVADVAEIAETDGFNVFVNTGESHGQEVPHFHAHILAGRKLV